jgi:hypothetical protein
MGHILQVFGNKVLWNIFGHACGKFGILKYDKLSISS